MKKDKLAVTILLFILGVLCFIFFEVKPLTLVNDALANKFLCGFVSRVGLSVLFIWLLYAYGGLKYLIFNRGFVMGLIWSLPCFMVAFINFPYSAIISGTASIDRPDLIGLYTLYIFGIALLEELIFRGVLLYVVDDFLRNKKHKPLLTVIICASIFSLFHLTNLFVGADIGSTLLQCLYTFLIGAMLTITMLKLNNVWLCVIIHMIFDFGGLLIIHIGSGNPWDTLFWILTIVGGVLAAGHFIFSLIKLEKDYVSR